MKTSFELIRVGTESLAAKYDSAKLDATVLLAYVTGFSRTKLLADPRTEISPAHCERFFELLAKRQIGTPVAYLTGEREFYALPFKVSPAVLIPRPETEQLVELAITQITHSDLPASTTVRILDLGTGSGCIAITLAIELKKRGRACEIIATDNSVQALSIALDNAVLLEAPGVRFVLSDWFSAITGEFQLVVSNPPYIPRNDPQVSPDTYFEPTAALYSGDDGCDAYHKLLAALPQYLGSDGVFIGEHGIEQAEALRNIAVAHGFSPHKVQTVPDLTGRDRFIVCRR